MNKITMKDLKIAKIGRVGRFQPCAEEFDEYLIAVNISSSLTNNDLLSFCCYAYDSNFITL